MRDFVLLNLIHLSISVEVRVDHLTSREFEERTFGLRTRILDPSLLRVIRKWTHDSGKDSYQNL